MAKDRIDAALKRLQEYVTLPYPGRKLVEDVGTPERVRADARNREMMERVLAAGEDGERVRVLEEQLVERPTAAPEIDGPPPEGCAYYFLPSVVVDGPRMPEGMRAEFTIQGVVEPSALPDRAPFRVTDWKGPVAIVTVERLA